MKSRSEIRTLVGGSSRRNLLCDCKTSRSLRQPSFKALPSTPPPPRPRHPQTDASLGPDSVLLCLDAPRHRDCQPKCAGLDNGQNGAMGTLKFENGKFETFDSWAKLKIDPALIKLSTIQKNNPIIPILSY